MGIFCFYILDLKFLPCCKIIPLIRGRKNHCTMTPKRKLLKRPARLIMASEWMKVYNGKNLISGYAKWFGVDKICAMNELKIIGVTISEAMKKQVLASVKARIEQKRIMKEKRNFVDDTDIDSDEYFAYIAGYTSGGAPYGLTHEEMRRIESEQTE